VVALTLVLYVDGNVQVRKKKKQKNKKNLVEVAVVALTLVLYVDGNVQVNDIWQDQTSVKRDLL
jgi:hypothetical protein